MYSCICDFSKIISKDEFVDIKLVGPNSQYNKKLIISFKEYATKIKVHLHIDVKKDSDMITIFIRGTKLKAEMMLSYIKFHPDNYNKYDFS